MNVGLWHNQPPERERATAGVWQARRALRADAVTKMAAPLPIGPPSCTARLAGLSNSADRSVEDAGLPGTTRTRTSEPASRSVLDSVGLFIEARRPASPVPPGAGGGLRMAVLVSLERAPPFLRSAAEGFGLPRISGAPSAPGDAPRGGARRRCGDISDEPQQSGAPQALRPPLHFMGLPLGRASSMLALLPMPPAWDRRAASNPPRPRGQRAESPWCPNPNPARPAPRARPCAILGMGSWESPGPGGANPTQSFRETY